MIGGFLIVTAKLETETNTGIPEISPGRSSELSDEGMLQSGYPPQPKQLNGWCSSSVMYMCVLMLLLSSSFVLYVFAPKPSLCEEEGHMCANQEKHKMDTNI